MARAVGDKELGMGVVALQRQARGASEENCEERTQDSGKGGRNSSDSARNVYCCCAIDTERVGHRIAHALVTSIGGGSGNDIEVRRNHFFGS